MPNFKPNTTKNQIGTHSVHSLTACAPSIVHPHCVRTAQGDVCDLSRDKTGRECDHLLLGINNRAYQFDTAHLLRAAPPLTIIAPINRDAVDQSDSALVAAAHQIRLSLTRIASDLQRMTERQTRTRRITKWIVHSVIGDEDCLRNLAIDSVAVAV